MTWTGPQESEHFRVLSVSSGTDGQTRTIPCDDADEAREIAIGFALARAHSGLGDVLDEVLRADDDRRARIHAAALGLRERIDTILTLTEPAKGTVTP